MDLRHFLTIGMILSGLLTIAFGMGYVWNIHYFAYFVTVQVPMIFFLMSYPLYICHTQLFLQDFHLYFANTASGSLIIFLTSVSVISFYWTY